MSLWRSLLFFGIAGALAALMHTYLYRRLVRDTTTAAKVRKIAIAVTVALAMVFPIQRLVLRAIPRSWGVALSTLTWFWMGFATYLFLWLVLFDSAKGLRALYVRLTRAKKTPEPVSPERRLFLSRALAGGALMSSGALAGYGFWRAFEPAELTEMPIRLSRLPKALDGLTIVQLTDLHISHIIRRPFVEELVRRTNALKPDLVAITGDLVDGDVDQHEDAVAPLRNLKSRYGTFFVTGNHDYYWGDVQWASALARMDIQVLRNRLVRIGDAGASLDLVGVDDWGARNLRRHGGYDLERAIVGRIPDRAAVLLAHEPANFETAVASGMDLQLSGHTHGGQLFPMTALVGMRWRYSRGLYTHGDGQLYVSRGIGFWGPPLRVGSSPEIVKFILLA